MLADVLHRIAGMEAEERGESRYSPRPSLAGPQRCLRQMVYWASGAERSPLPGRALVVMEDSSWHEELTADLIRRGAFQVHSAQMPVNLAGALRRLGPNPGQWKCAMCGQMVNREDLHGHLDFIVTDLLGEDWLVEHKALSHWGFEGLLKDVHPLPLPLDYLTQLAIYMRAVQRWAPKMARGLLLVKNKNQSGYLEFQCRYNHEADCMTVERRVHHTGEVTEIGVTLPGIVEAALAKFAEVRRHRSDGTLPPRQYTLDDWQCDYCPYASRCWEDFCVEVGKRSPENDLSSLEVLAEEYKALGKRAGEIKKSREGLMEKMKEGLRLKAASGGMAGPWLLQYTAGTQERVDLDKLSREAKAAASVLVPTERLNIKLVKTGTTKKGKRNDKAIHDDQGAVAGAAAPAAGQDSAGR